jgi:transcriptional regulator with XRE-family HTH domain
MMNQRIRERRGELGLTQTIIAKFIGVSKASVSNWEIGDSKPKGENFYKLCEILKCSPEWMLRGKSVDNYRKDIVPKHKDIVPKPNGFVHKIPLIPWLQVVNRDLFSAEFRRNGSSQCYKTTANVGQNAFATRAEDYAIQNLAGFQSPFGSTTVVVDPDANLTNNVVVIAVFKHSSDLTLKRLVLDGPNQYLKSLNTEYKIIHIKNDYDIIGVVKKMEIEI